MKTYKAFIVDAQGFLAFEITTNFHNSWESAEKDIKALYSAWCQYNGAKAGDGAYFYDMPEVYNGKRPTIADNVNMCPRQVPSCKKTCLDTAGRSKSSNVQAARRGRITWK